MNAAAGDPGSRYAMVHFSGLRPIEQRIALLDGAIRAADRLAASIAENDAPALLEHASTCRALILHLLESIDRSAVPVLGEALTRLHLYEHERLLHAVASVDAAPAAEVRSLLSAEREAWRIRSLQGSESSGRALEPPRRDARGRYDAVA